MLSKPYVNVRSVPAKPGRVSNHARRRCNGILAQPRSAIRRRPALGVLAGKGDGTPFIERVRGTRGVNRPLREVAEALLSAWQAINAQASTIGLRGVVAPARD
jgi:hypothetical protein